MKTQKNKFLCQILLHFSSKNMKKHILTSVWSALSKRWSKYTTDIILFDWQLGQNFIVLKERSTRTYTPDKNSPELETKIPGTFTAQGASCAADMGYRGSRGSSHRGTEMESSQEGEYLKAVTLKLNTSIYRRFLCRYRVDLS